jgi:uncharacterized protein YjbI with pentapeptide repeats
MTLKSPTRLLFSIAQICLLFVFCGYGQNGSNWCWKDDKGRKRTQAELNKILDKHRRWVFMMKDKLGEIDPLARRANLSGADLTLANLRGMELQQIDFSRTDLKRADLSNAQLFRANFTGADLTHANLSGASLMDTNMTKTSLGVRI